MINITKLLYGISSFGDRLRYKKKKNLRPVVVWNITRRCNLNCVHCYSDSFNKKYPGELKTKEAENLIKDLADFGVPVILFSGGEPILRKDIFKLASLAKKFGIYTVLSTNGTLIDKEMAKDIKENFDYVGISLDGIGENNDRFRGKKGAYNLALLGIRNLKRLGQKIGLRFTITKRNYLELPKIFDLVEREDINRVCFYHLVYSGRGSNMFKDDLTHIQMRECIDNIFDWVNSLYRRKIKKEVLTVDNHADGVYLYLKLKRKDPKKAERVLKLLRYNGGNNSGIGIACIDNLGFVYADQFLKNYSFGNVLKRRFEDIWLDKGNPFLKRLRERKIYLKGRCKICKFLDICNGNFRARALAVYKDIWEEDPACYLCTREIT
ncbi:MAG: radical SAM protein [Candidatus Omnitrophica bacterium]|nr:radical SAM protein [Candidatus Omnitrophota bacterium]